MPVPLPIHSHAARSCALAASRRGYHNNGVLITRPSRSSTIRKSFVKRTAMPRGASCEVLVPCLLDSVFMFDDQFFICVSSWAAKPSFLASVTGCPSQNFASLPARAAWTWGGSPASLLKKKKRKGQPGILTVGIHGIMRAPRRGTSDFRHHPKPK